MANKKEICFLCGKARLEADTLLKGKFGYICSDCVAEAYELLNDKKEKEISDNMRLVTPRQIKEHLDLYVVGQDEAKKTLAVSVYNHRDITIIKEFHKAKSQMLRYKRAMFFLLALLEVVRHIWHKVWLSFLEFHLQSLMQQH